MAKVFLGAIFTYQATYWLWTKLEMDEIKHDKTGMDDMTAFSTILLTPKIVEIHGLEAKLAPNRAIRTK